MNFDDRMEKEINNLSVKSFLKWAFVFISIVCVLAIVERSLGAFSSVATAPGRVVKKTLDTNNIIQSYEWFYDVNAAFNARVNQVKQFKSLFNNEPDSSEKNRLRIELTAIQQTCRELATKYNANSEKMNKSIFKGWSLPKKLLINNCEV